MVPKAFERSCCSLATSGHAARTRIAIIKPTPAIRINVRLRPYEIDGSRSDDAVTPESLRCLPSTRKGHWFHGGLLVARRGFEPLTSSLKGKRPSPLGDRAALLQRITRDHSLTH